MLDCCKVEISGSRGGGGGYCKAWCLGQRVVGGRRLSHTPVDGSRYRGAARGPGSLPGRMSPAAAAGGGSGSYCLRFVPPALSNGIMSERMRRPGLLARCAFAGICGLTKGFLVSIRGDAAVATGSLPLSLPHKK